MCFIFSWLYYSHELRTPMAAVIGLLDILISDDCLTNEQYSTVTQIRKCSTALLRLLNNILDLSKVTHIYNKLNFIFKYISKPIALVPKRFLIFCAI